MYTVCPKCDLPLAVTAADLRAGQGYVRCGRCSNVFNALLRLSEESAFGQVRPEDSSSYRFIEDKASATMTRPALTPAEREALARGGDPDLPEDEPTDPEPGPAAAILQELEYSDTDSTNPKIGIAPLRLLPPEPALRSPPLRLVDPTAPTSPELDIEDLSDEQTPEANEVYVDEDPAEAHEEFLDEQLGNHHGTGTFETIVLEGDTFLQTEEIIPEEVLASEIASVSRRLAQAHHTAEFAALIQDEFEDEPPSAPQGSETEAEPASELAALREATGEFKPDTHRQWADDDPSTWFRRIHSWGDWRLIGGAAALAVVLMVQMLNHGRDELAAHPGWFGPMHKLASWFGEPLHPNWDLAAYDLRQLGASPDSADDNTLKVRLSLTNVSEHAQGLPLIRITLRDRYGKAVSRGELTPAQYLPAGRPHPPLLRRDERIDTELRVLDPGRQASSFELDVCVAAAGDRLRCAGDAPTLAARPS